MSIIKDTFFGGAEKKAAQAQQNALEQSQDFIRQGVGEGRDIVNELYPAAQDMSRAGFQGALDVFGQYMPQQADVYQQGNVGAQQALLSALPQMNNAILGNQIDYSSMQPQQLSYDPSFFSQQLPAEMVAASNSQAQAQQAQQGQQNQGPLSMIGNMGYLGSRGASAPPPTFAGSGGNNFNLNSMAPSRYRF